MSTTLSVRLNNCISSLPTFEFGVSLCLDELHQGNAQVVLTPDGWTAKLFLDSLLAAAQRQLDREVVRVPVVTGQDGKAFIPRVPGPCILALEDTEKLSAAAQDSVMARLAELAGYEKNLHHSQRQTLVVSLASGELDPGPFFATGGAPVHCMLLPPLTPDEAGVAWRHLSGPEVDRREDVVADYISASVPEVSGGSLRFLRFAATQLSQLADTPSDKDVDDWLAHTLGSYSRRSTHQCIKLAEEGVLGDAMESLWKFGRINRSVTSRFRLAGDPSLLRLFMNEIAYPTDDGSWTVAPTAMPAIEQPQVVLKGSVPASLALWPRTGSRDILHSCTAFEVHVRYALELLLTTWYSPTGQVRYLQQVGCYRNLMRCATRRGLQHTPLRVAMLSDLRSIAAGELSELLGWGEALDKALAEVAHIRNELAHGHSIGMSKYRSLRAAFAFANNILADAIRESFA